MAYDAFVKSIMAFPYGLHGVASLAATTLPSALFDSAPLKHLATLVDRVTYMAACELFRAPASVPLVAWPNFPCPDGRALVVGALMERQLASLEECRWKQGVRAVVNAVLDAAAGLYEQEGCAVRRARVLVRKLEMGYYCEEGEGQYKEMKRLGGEVERLLTAEVRSKHITFIGKRSAYKRDRTSTRARIRPSRGTRPSSVQPHTCGSRRTRTARATRRCPPCSSRTSRTRVGC